MPDENCPTMSMKPTFVDLFSGIGGASLAAHCIGFDVAAHCENDAFCSSILHKHWSTTPNLGDINEVTAASFRGVGVSRIDLLHASPPCQALSIAGKRKGKADKRYLWPQTFRVLESLADTELKPTWVCIENVAHVVALVLDDWLSDLASIGYSCGTVVFPSAASGAPQLRDRVFVLALSNGIQSKRRRGDRALARSPEKDERETPQWERLRDAPSNSGSAIPESLSLRRESGQECDSNATPYSTNGDTPRRDTYGCGSATGVGLADAPLFGPQGEWDASRLGRRRLEDCDGNGCRSLSESRLGRDADGLPARMDLAGLMAHRWPAMRGMEQHDYEPPRTVYGPDKQRASRIKALGNAVVPAQIAPIFSAIYDHIQATAEDVA